MSAEERTAWWVTIIFSFGLAYPFYRARKRVANHAGKTVAR
jgi:hypothetical protein